MGTAAGLAVRQHITDTGPVFLLSPYLSVSIWSGMPDCEKGNFRMHHGHGHGRGTYSFCSRLQHDRSAQGGLGSPRLGPDATIHTSIAAKMHDGTDDDASSGIWPAMRRSSGQTLLCMASSPGRPPRWLCLSWRRHGGPVLHSVIGSLSTTSFFSWDELFASPLQYPTPETYFPQLLLASCGMPRVCWAEVESLAHPTEKLNSPLGAYPSGL